MKTFIGPIALSLVGLAAAGEVHGAGYPWMDHAPPHDFLFGNDFDTH